ncbi:hypothetical protein [Cellulomonas sp. P24]|uniref:hypothetical protein n=1 Tax=Cellulomonas sp. P24 TaxID=2885206 RepID=UPI00216AB670|nr:hypothetical protein [Cellulomonas sp. P24]MCR6491757.1 hypothetical protein [Cellulomonas sp. P24]
MTKEYRLRPTHQVARLQQCCPDVQLAEVDAKIGWRDHLLTRNVHVGPVEIEHND